MSKRCSEDKQELLGLLERMGIDEVIKEVDETHLNEGHIGTSRLDGSVSPFVLTWQRLHSPRACSVSF